MTAEQPSTRHNWLAHSKGASGQVQTMQEHLSNVEEQTLERCPSFLRADARLAALYHDFGKYSLVFDRRLKGLEQGLDHWTPGAHFLFNCGRSELAGVAVHAHHVGLGVWNNVKELKTKLISLENRKLTLQNREQLNEAFGAMLADGFKPQECERGRSLKGTVGSMLDARMVLSALVDADYSDTARHMHGEERPVALALNARIALANLEAYLATLGANASTEVREARTDLWNAAIAAADNPSGLFELEAPTGTGKTLAMLGFALKHIMRHQERVGLRRIIVVLPFLSILDQTVKAYRKALQSAAIGLLEHHSLATWRQAKEKKPEEDGESEARKMAEALSENWEAPIIITTTVQLLESLFTDHPGTSRKLCALSRSVILLDEVQSLPRRLISPTLRAISRLCHSDYGSTVVVATATQPLFSRFASEVVKDGENIGWQPKTIAPRTMRLYERTHRYTIDWSRSQTEVSWNTIAGELAGERRALCIVNTRKDARHLAELLIDLKPQSPVVHLSTNMCAAHRRVVIEYNKIKDPNARCLLISTQCVEAGVDLDFPVVYRALAPLDAIAQAAGRCNRGGCGSGQVRVFLPENAHYPGGKKGDYQQGAAQTMSLLEDRGDLDPQAPEVFDRYFDLLYGLKNLPGTTEEIEAAIKLRDFPEVARLYRLIEPQGLLHIIVPYAGVPAIPQNEHALNGAFFRAVQPFVVEANRKDAAASSWLGQPLPGAWDWYELTDKTAYDDTFGLKLDEELPIIIDDKFISNR